MTRRYNAATSSLSPTSGTLTQPSGKDRRPRPEADCPVFLDREQNVGAADPPPVTGMMAENPSAICDNICHRYGWRSKHCIAARAGGPASRPGDLSQQKQLHRGPAPGTYYQRRTEARGTATAA